MDTNDRECRLRAVSHARKVEYLVTDPRLKDALDMAEKYANGRASLCELNAAENSAYDAAFAISTYKRDLRWNKCAPQENAQNLAAAWAIYSTLNENASQAEHFAYLNAGDAR